MSPAEACLISFADEPDRSREAVVAIREPRATWAYADAIPVSDALNEASQGAREERKMIFIFLTAGATTPFELQKTAEDWIAGRSNASASAPLEIQFRSERLLWQRDRALCLGTGEITRDIIAAVARFSFCEGELARLESQINASWNTLGVDIELTHSVSAKDLQRQPHVDAMTKIAASMRIAFVRLQSAMEAPATELSGVAKRIFGELALQAHTVERLRMLDDSVEVTQDLYELANDRLSEFRYFLREYRIEVLIVIVLVVEVALTLCELILVGHNLLF